ncbi:MAG: hypothetical protein E6I75_27465 [Chloroflexi bacterium]|nr:MAG: hypothetical protein E6I75_27465 [Chloroflexota bacterium]
MSDGGWRQTQLACDSTIWQATLGHNVAVVGDNQPYSDLRGACEFHSLDRDGLEREIVHGWDAHVIEMVPREQ